MDKRQEVIKYIASVEKQLYALFGNTYHAALKLTEVRKAIESGASFTWKGNPAAERKLDRYLKDLSSKTALITKNGIIGSWDKGEARGKGTGVRSIREDFDAAERNYRHLRTGSKGTPGQRSNGPCLRQCQPRGYEPIYPCLEFDGEGETRT